MDWSEAIQAQIKSLPIVDIDSFTKQKMFSLLDFTRLNKNDSEQEIAAWSAQAITTLGHVAAVCVYPEFVRLMADTFRGRPINIATVVNFPSGDANLEQVLVEIGRAIQDGANEIDVVFPYRRYLAAETQYAKNFIQTCKAACGEQTLLKVILETGALSDPAIIADATFDVVAAGADFVKTSTGKIQEGATLEAAAVILLVIKHMGEQLQRPVGIKISGGIKTPSEAVQYLALAEQIMGKAWPSKLTFRIGASQLIEALLK